MSVASVAIGVAKFLRDRKGIKEDKSRYDQEWDLKERQAEQQMAIELQQAEREKARMAPGGVKTVTEPFARGFGASSREEITPEGIGHKLARLQGSLAEKQVGGYETPAQQRIATGFETPEAQRTAAEEWEKKMAELKHQYDLALSGLKQGEVEEAPFDETGAFDIKYFFETATDRYPEFSFFQMVDEGEILKARDEIRNIVVGRFGSDPAKTQAIETALDMWINGLFEMSKNMPEEEKNRSFGEVISKFGAWLTTPIGGEPRMTRREISKIPKMEEGPPIGVEFPAKTEPDLQVRLPTFEDKEQQLQGLTKDKGFLKNIFKKRKDQTRGLTGIMMGH